MAKNANDWLFCLKFVDLNLKWAALNLLSTIVYTNYNVPNTPTCLPHASINLGKATVLEIKQRIAKNLVIQQLILTIKKTFSTKYMNQILPPIRGSNHRLTTCHFRTRPKLCQTINKKIRTCPLIWHKKQAIKYLKMETAKQVWKKTLIRFPT